MAIGVVVSCREWADRQGPLPHALAADTHGVYLIRVGGLLGLQAALAGVDLPPLVKFGLVTLAGVPRCFLLVDGLRRLAGLWQGRRRMSSQALL
jgi:hypothetical protein